MTPGLAGGRVEEKILWIFNSQGEAYEPHLNPGLAEP